MINELEMLKAKVARIERQQACCNHEWLEVESEPERKERTRTVIKPQGSDIWWDVEGTGIFETVDRWSRTCSKCGKKEYTYTKEVVPIKTITRPKF